MITKTETNVILIVDDEPVGREALEGPLLNQGYTLKFAEDGPQAIEVALQVRPDVILLDVMMPGMTGYEVCQRLRAEPALAEVPIVMVTALDDRRSRLQGLEAGADDFLSKPFDRAELRARVRTITRLNRYRRLQTERAKFEWVVDHAAEGYVMVDGADRIQYANAQARRFLMLDEEAEFPSALTFAACASRQYQMEPETVWEGWPLQSLFAKFRAHYLVRPETDVSTAFWLQVEVLDLPGGAATDHLLRLWDITAEKVSQRNTWSFHSIISHKLRTPIAAMQSSLSYLVEYKDQLAPDELALMSDTALRGALRLRSEVDEIMQYTRDHRLTTPETVPARLAEWPARVLMVAEQTHLEPVPVGLSETAGAIATRLSLSALELVLGELYLNARKFHPTQTPRVEVRVNAEADPVLVEVWDDGVTLSPEQLAQVWTPYYQGEKYFTGESRGMGLGLAMVASLIWEAGGRCRMYNRPDARPGVVVELSLPRLREPGESA